MKFYLFSFITGFMVFMILPLGISEFPQGTFGPLDLPRTFMNFYPNIVSIWKQYESAGLLPPSVWDFNSINLFANLIFSLLVPVIIYKKIKPKLY